ncbi:MAG: CPBP family intramembrane glutamic endopeptidase [Saprospiraceae bacterium]|nr:CPBP family intramembrane metalloprotease [Saprospiraceae bacterium]
MFLKNAQSGENKWWQYLATIAIIVAGNLIGQLPLFFLYLAMVSNSNASETDIAHMTESLDFTAIGIGQNLSLLLVLMAFVFSLLGLWVGVKYIHKRPFISLITPSKRINWGKILFSFGLWMGLTILSELVFYALNPENYSLHFEPGQFFGLLIIAILVLPFQTSFEELIFRGYLMQGIGLIGIYRWVPLLISSAAFGLLHFMNPEVHAFGTGVTMTYYISVGLFLGFLTLMDDSLELALGIHAATNIYGALFVTFDESALQTAALFHTQSVNMSWMLAGFFVAAIVFTFIAAKNYQWTDWTKWYAKIETQQIGKV